MDQVLAFRIAAQGLTERTKTATEVAASFTLQDSPPHAALTALDARSSAPERLDELLEQRELVAVPSPRTAITILPAADVATFLQALQPPDERALETILLRATRSCAGSASPAGRGARTRSRGRTSGSTSSRRRTRRPSWCAATCATSVRPRRRTSPRGPGSRRATRRHS